MPNIGEIIKYITQGVAEDITHNKAIKGLGKWDDVVKTKKKKKPILPKKYPKNIQDRFDDEEKEGIHRGPGPWGKK